MSVEIIEKWIVGDERRLGPSRELLTSTQQIIEGLNEFGEVKIQRITPQHGRLIGLVYVPVGYPGSSTTGAPEGCAIMGVVSFDGGETWELL